MPLYDYQCISCQNELRDVFQKMSENPLVKCPNCGKKKLERIITTAPYGIVNQDPKTLKHLADRNTQKMGHYEYEARCEEEKKKRQGYSKFKESGYDVVKPDYERPFWRDSDVIDKSLATMTPEQKQKYILKGEKP